MIKDTLFMPKVMFKKCNFVKHIKNRRSYDQLFKVKKALMDSTYLIFSVLAPLTLFLLLMALSLPL